MLINPPFSGNFPVSQRFGENPARYADLSCGGVSLLGHNGVDFATPAGTPIQAVQAGVVLAARSDPGRFGNLVILGHEWGQSLYAHLDSLGVQAGQQVAAGQPLGRSGNSGLSDGPHLHFGLRITPFSVQDGWCGYADPQPYLERLTQGRGSIIGAHLIGGIDPHLEALRRWQPRLLLVVDPNPDEMHRLREACPATTIIGRIFVPDSEMADRIRANPQQAAQWAHERVLARQSAAVDYWQLANEILQTEADLPALHAFEQQRMLLAEAANYRCALFAFSVGNPDLPEADRLRAWRLLYPALARAEQAGHIVALHQYGKPDLFTTLPDWLTYRLEHQVLRRLPFKKLQFAVTEFGIDGSLGGNPPQGWQGFTNAEDYVTQLLRAGRYLERFSGRVLGYATFTLGNNPPWQSYDIAGAVVNLLAERAPRGTWSTVNTSGTGLAPGDSGDANETGVGSGTTLPPVTPPVTPPPVTPPPVIPDPVQPDKPVVEPPPMPNKPLVERRLSEAFNQFHLNIRNLDQRPDKPGGDLVYLVKDIFTTRDGVLEPGGDAASLPQWAREAYFQNEFDGARNQTHLFAAVLGLDGSLSKEVEVRFWSDGFDRLGDSGYDGYTREYTKQNSGWASIALFGSSAYNAAGGEAGPWCWSPGGAAEVVCGGGLPNGAHIATFVVWQAVRRVDWAAQTTQPSQPVEPPVTPPVTPPPVTPPKITRRLGNWIQPLNVTIRGLAERPDHPVGEVIYLLKHLWTTRDGQWDDSNQGAPGAVDDWARIYLKPPSAPDFFDDAGADHHLFGAVIGLDGEFMRNLDMVYWSDGFDKLGDPNYHGYAIQPTKERSGWANIFMGPSSSFVPERGEHGPWCWAPAGAAEVVCGGGMPAKQHVSFFAVWQAVRSSEIEQPTPPITTPPATELDHHIFLPVIMGRAVAPAAASAPMAVEGVALPLGAPLPAEGFTSSAQTVLRSAAWNRLGIEFNPDSPLAAYARHHRLGMPVTQEFAVAGYTVQGYHGGIVYAPVNEPESVKHMGW